jgi:hypothetical protein
MNEEEMRYTVSVVAKSMITNKSMICMKLIPDYNMRGLLRRHLQ